jgi:hypothetical protein
VTESDVIVELAVGELPPGWPDDAPNPWAVGDCGLKGCWCSPEAQAAVAFAAARLLVSARALAAEWDPEVSPRSAAAAKSLLRTTAALYREAAK